MNINDVLTNLPHHEKTWKAEIVNGFDGSGRIWLGCVHENLNRAFNLGIKGLAFKGFGNFAQNPPTPYPHMPAEHRSTLTLFRALLHVNTVICVSIVQNLAHLKNLDDHAFLIQLFPGINSDRIVSAYSDIKRIRNVNTADDVISGNVCRNMCVRSQTNGILFDVEYPEYGQQLHMIIILTILAQYVTNGIVDQNSQDHFLLDGNEPNVLNANLFPATAENGEGLYCAAQLIGERCKSGLAAYRLLIIKRPALLDGDMLLCVEAYFSLVYRSLFRNIFHSRGTLHDAILNPPHRNKLGMYAHDLGVHVGFVEDVCRITHEEKVRMGLNMKELENRIIDFASNVLATSTAVVENVPDLLQFWINNRQGAIAPHGVHLRAVRAAAIRLRKHDLNLGIDFQFNY